VACAVEPRASSVLIASGGDSIAKYPDGKQIENRKMDAGSLSISSDGANVAVAAGHYGLTSIHARRISAVGEHDIAALRA